MTVILAVPGRKGHLTGAYLFSSLGHVHLVFLSVDGLIEYQHSRQTLRNGLGGQDTHFTVCQVDGLLRCHDDVLVVGQNKDCLGRGGMNSRQNIIGGGVHGLTALDHIGHTQILEELLHTVTGTYCHKAIGIARINRSILETGSHGFPYCLLVVGMLLPHILDLDLGQRAVPQSILQGIAGVIGVHMALDDVIVVHYRRCSPDRSAEPGRLPARRP